jgi:dihydropteroate synthase type 2
MHANPRAAGEAEDGPEVIFEEIHAFFENRILGLTEAGIARDRLILDPGMGFFLGRNPEASFFVLRRIAQLKKAFGLPTLVSVSRKSFLRAVTGRAPSEAAAATLAAELFAAGQGVDYIRTHDPAALRDALVVAQRLEESAAPMRPNPVVDQISQRSGQNPLL